jgi:hypothetical protein
MILSEAQKTVLIEYLTPLLNWHLAPGKSWETTLREVAEELSRDPLPIAKVVQKHVYRELYEIVPRGDA